MTRRNQTLRRMAVALLALLTACCFSFPSLAQDQAAAAPGQAAAGAAPDAAAQAPDPLDDDEL